MNENAKNAMNALLKECNVLGRSGVADAMAAALAGEHRTIQQNFMRELKEAMRNYRHVGADLRNEGAVKLANEIAESEVYLPLV